MSSHPVPHSDANPISILSLSAIVSIICLIVTTEVSTFNQLVRVQAFTAAASVSVCSKYPLVCVLGL